MKLSVTKLKIYTTLGYIFNYKMFHKETPVDTIKMSYKIVDLTFYDFCWVIERLE